jgi:hypothetical protein
MVITRLATLDLILISPIDKKAKIRFKLAILLLEPLAGELK